MESRQMLSYCVLAGLFLSVCVCAAAEFQWQQPQATVTETGAIEWSPRAFVDDLEGKEVRYIDYEGGGDRDDGRTPWTAWKHHPWDHEAAGRSARCSGVKTYVFKRGVLYRGQLYNEDDSGTAEEPIRLTSTAAWGEGRATLVGSRRLPATWVKATQVDHPERLAEPHEVWALDLTRMPWWNDGRPGYRNRGQYRNNRSNRRTIEPPFIGLFSLEQDGRSVRNHLARHPDWQRAGSEFAHDYWPSWDGDARPYQRYQQLGAHDEELKGFPQDYFTGAIFWSTYPGLMGGATPKQPLPETVEVDGRAVPAYDPARGYFYIRNQSGFSKGTRYKIENLPQHLDTVREFYLDTDKNVLFYHPPRGTTPNEMHLELVTNHGLLALRDQTHIDISGLTFAYVDGTAIMLYGSSEHISIRNCVFHDLMEHAIRNLLKPDYPTWKERYENHPQIIQQWKPEWLDNIVIADNEFYDIWDSTISFSDAKSWNNELSRRATSWPWGRLGHVEILRNRLVNVGIRHQGSRYSSIPAIAMVRAQTGRVAGNIVKRSFGAGIMVQGGQTGGMKGSDWPLSRILVYHNSTEDTAMAVNDYGGFSLWQSGVIYIYNNNIGNSTGHMPGGLFGNGKPTNLSYPYYIDGGYKIYGFNNIVWDRSANPEDLYASRTAGYFSVFGFLNHFTNNTLYRHYRALGGSSGNRTDIVSNVFCEITGQFLQNNRVENPSLIGGGDTGATGIAGIPSLAYGRNIFRGPARAGELVSTNEGKGWTVHQPIRADTIEAMAEQMQTFPMRYGQLGTEVDELPIVGETEPNGLTEKGAMAADFRLGTDSPAIDAGAKYFVPWALYANVGEWNFTENRADPTRVVDYAFYMSEPHFERFMYVQIPINSLKLNRATLGDYVPAPSEDWVNGALRFDGQRYGVVTDAEMRADIELNINEFVEGNGQVTWKKWAERPELWQAPEPAGGYDDEGNPKYSDDQVARYPGERRHTLISRKRNLLLEVKFRTEGGHTGGVLMNKQAGGNGYSLRVNADGAAEFAVSSGGATGTVATAKAVNDGQWHHVIAEVGRESGRMTVYLDGRASAESRAPFGPDASLDCSADFTVGRSSAADTAYFVGAIDFMRVCQGTLEDAKTSIKELYAWQYVNGPHLFDMRGRPPKGGRRDAGALELK